MSNSSEDAEYEDLHPITQMLGNVGPLLVGGSVPLAIISHLYDFPGMMFVVKMASFGLALFILGAVTIPVLNRDLF